MFERYNEPARETLFFARHEATQLGGVAVEPEHLLLGLLREPGGLAARVFSAARLSQAAVRAEVQKRFPARETLPLSAEMPFSPETVRILVVAADESERLGHAHIGTEHLLLGVLADSASLAGNLLRDNGVEQEAIRRQIIERTRQ